MLFALDTERDQFLVLGEPNDRITYGKDLMSISKIDMLLEFEF